MQNYIYASCKELNNIKIKHYFICISPCSFHYLLISVSGCFMLILADFNPGRYEYHSQPFVFFWLLFLNFLRLIGRQTLLESLASLTRVLLQAEGLITHHYLVHWFKIPPPKCVKIEIALSGLFLECRHLNLCVHLCFCRQIDYSHQLA